MGAEELTVIVSAVVALGAAVVSGVLSTRTARTTARVQYELEQQRRSADKDQLVEDVMTPYREPLLRAAFDLQSRLYNIVERKFLDLYHRDGSPEERAYAETSTLFVFAEYLGWVEIIRRGVQFLDLGDIERNRLLAARLDAIAHTLLTSQPARGQFNIFRGQQRAIGELMLDTGRGDETARIPQCIGFATFTARLEQDGSFGRWLEPLRQSTQTLAAGDQAAEPRLRQLQHDLLDLLDFLDADHARFPPHVRRRL